MSLIETYTSTSGLEGKMAEICDFLIKKGQLQIQEDDLKLNIEQGQLVRWVKH
jgi:hypothetical protein